MRAEEIKDRESLRAWLESLPQETEAERETARRWAVTIAHRAAMRVLPVYWHGFVTNEVGMPIPITETFHLFILQSLRAFVPTDENRKIAYRFKTRAEQLEVEWRHGRIAQGDPAAYAEIVKGYAVCSLGSDPDNILHMNLRVLAEHTVDSIVFASDSARRFYPYLYPEDIWDEVSVDCARAEANLPFLALGLWNNDVNRERDEHALGFLWNEIRPKILAQGEGWRFWVEWYENALYGRPQDYDLLTKIALIDPADWDNGADHVNALIAQIRLEHIAETRPLGEDAIDIGPDGLWHRTGKSDIHGDILQDAVESVQDEIATLRTKLQGPQGNMFTALVSDLDLLEQRIARHPDRPLRLHDLFLRVQGHIARNLDSGELPDDDCVRDLSSVLGNAALDMCNACDKTKAVVQKRMAVRFSEIDETSRKGLRLLTEGAAAISDAELAEEFREDVTTAIDPDLPSDEKKEAQYRLHTRLSQMVVRGGDNIFGALVFLGGIGGGLDTLGAIIMFLLRLVIGP